MTTSTEIWANSVRQKWTTTSWTQDDTNLSYQKNPRSIETNIYDAAGNRRRTAIAYVTVGLPEGVTCSLLSDIFEYAGDATTLLRHTYTEYYWTSDFLSRHIIGLRGTQIIYDGAGNIQSKTNRGYDWGAPYLQDTSAPTIQHDSSYGPSFVSGRGNLTVDVRYDVTDPTNETKALQLYFGYNTNGSLNFSIDARGHQTNVIYLGNWSNGSNHNSFAYPTQVQDADGYWSYMQYNFDFGAVTWQQTPSPNAGQTAPTVSYSYDSAARIQQVTNGVNGAYTRWVYAADGLNYLSFSTIQDGAGEAYSLTGTDGAGRTRAAIADLPNSSGGYVASWRVYDAMGRVVQSYNPAEVNASWNPVGDDSAGWIGTVQTYDWKGRPLLTTNSDGSTRENTYGGCGCAGGEVVTARDEAGRRTRTTMDVVGRLWKVEELNYDQTVYSTTTYGYNVRDQIGSINHAGQTRSFDYDGHGRVWHRTTPEQGTCAYTYWEDDTLKSMSDARGAKSTFNYNGRHLVTSVAYDVSQAPGVVATSNVSYGYDAAGNRTSMTDGLGSVSYGYDQLSRMTAETRTFTSLGSFNLSYQYNLAGELTSITNPWSVVVGYLHDKIGRVTSVSGAGYAGISSYVSNIAYRAFGAAKQVSYGNGKTLSMQYNNRLFLTQWNIPGLLGYAYHYDNYSEANTGRVTFMDNLTNGAARDGSLDRAYIYDHLGRLALAYTGSEARATIGTDTWDHPDGPYAHGYSYDVWGNRTHREGWGGIYGSYVNDYASFTNNRTDGLTYDAAGNFTAAGTANYDATGQQVAYTTGGLTHAFDGDRMRGKKVDNSVTTYYLRSSVLGGQVVAEINASSIWTRGYVYLAGQMLAIQYNGSVTWVHQEPITKSQRFTDSAGNSTGTILEVDPWGGDTGRSVNRAFQPHLYTSYERDSDVGDDAMNRRYAPYPSRFSQPDPYDGSYDFTDPQSFNRYSYVENDPVNSTDPSGLIGPGLHGISDAISALQSPTCNSLFGGRNGVDFLRTYLMNGLIRVDFSYPQGRANRPGIEYKTFQGDVPGAVTSPGGTGGILNPTTGRFNSARLITINARGFYYTGSVNGRDITRISGAGFEGFSRGQIQAAVIIHELLHAAGVFGPDSPDVLHDNGAQSQRYSERVRLYCFLIPKLSNRNAPLSPGASEINTVLNGSGARNGGGVGGIGGGGYPGWYYSMIAFLAATDAIMVGPDPIITVTGCVGSDCGQRR